MLRFLYIQSSGCLYCTWSDHEWGYEPDYCFPIALWDDIWIYVLWIACFRLLQTCWPLSINNVEFSISISFWYIFIFLCSLQLILEGNASVVVCATVHVAHFSICLSLIMDSRYSSLFAHSYSYATSCICICITVNCWNCSINKFCTENIWLRTFVENAWPEHSS